MRYIVCGDDTEEEDADEDVDEDAAGDGIVCSDDDATESVKPAPVVEPNPNDEEESDDGISFGEDITAGWKNVTTPAGDESTSLNRPYKCKSSW